MDEATIFNLFDHKTAGEDQLHTLSGGLDRLWRARSESDALWDVLAYYIGHGTLDGEGRLSLLVRSSQAIGSGIRVSDLALTLMRAAPRTRRLLILDCCFSGNAVPILRGRGAFGEAVAKSAAVDIASKLENKRGLLLCSSPAGKVSKAISPEGTNTLFTGAVLEVLRDGVSDGSSMLSFEDVRQSAYSRMLDRVGSDAPQPVLVPIHPNHRHLLRIPAFPNRATALKERAGGTAGSPLGETGAMATIENSVGDLMPLPEDGTPERPPCAEDYGSDEYGTWATFGVQGWKVKQLLRWVRPGSFDMGSPDTEEGRFDSEGPCRKAEIEYGFWMFETACPEALWWAVMDANGPGSQDGADFPVTDVSWDDAVAFVSALNAKVTGLSFALPTEEQWEYACRGGSQTPFSCGETAMPELVRFEADGPAPVSSLVQNPWGLRGMHGNVWEWCFDPWSDGYNGRTTNERRAARGGSWEDDARAARSASRYGFARAQRVKNLGFRCVAGSFEQRRREAPLLRSPGVAQTYLGVRSRAGPPRSVRGSRDWERLPTPSMDAARVFPNGHVR